MSLPVSSSQPTVGLFVTCAVDLMRPSVGFAAVKLLQQAGYRVVVPPQSCCGQVAYNNGLPGDTRTQAMAVAQAFAAVDVVVVPSGSCASMLKNHYPALFDHGNDHINAFAAKVHELTCFLADVANSQDKLPAAAASDKRIAYHDSCAGLRELNIREQPRKLLRDLTGSTVEDIVDGDTCCGFGGTFCVKFADISNKMVTDKANHIRGQNPQLLLGGDLTCLINLAGKLQRQGEEGIEVRHIAEYLAGDTNTPAIGLK